MPFWDQVFAEQVAAHPGLDTDQLHIDALAAMVVLRPGRFDVIVASNLFGDILSDLVAAVAGSIGVAPVGEPQPRARAAVDVRARPRLGPRHRRAGDRQPDRRDLVGRHDARPPRRGGGGGRGHGRRRAVLAAGTRTRDLGGTASTDEFVRAVCNEVT
jgi:tartrate dehydrogenase/decarboxylase/D-malate dehydrogenase